jgi:hypothetical protein
MDECVELLVLLLYEALQLLLLLLVLHPLFASMLEERISSTKQECVIRANKPNCPPKVAMNPSFTKTNSLSLLCETKFCLKRTHWDVVMERC